VFFAPVGARIIGYGLPVSAAARDYAHALVCDAAVREWRSTGLKDTYDPEPYRLDLPADPWPDTWPD
jgi:glutathione S-transferase